MPEGPEVRIITEGLYEKARNTIINNIEVIGGRFVKQSPEGLFELKKLLPIKIESVFCKGKAIGFRLDRGWYIFNTLGMTGSWSDKRDKHSAIKIDIEKFPLGEKSSIYFTDARHFGNIAFGRGFVYLGQKLPKGWDMLSGFFVPVLSQEDNLRKFKDILRESKKTLAETLMDQSKIAGIGNYIKSESLYRAKLSPFRICNELNHRECSALYVAIMEVLFASYEAGGATLATYKNFEGKFGKFSEQFKVYKKKTDCEGRVIVRETTPDKRTTWWVPSIQL